MTEVTLPNVQLLLDRPKGEGMIVSCYAEPTPRAPDPVGVGLLKPPSAGHVSYRDRTASSTRFAKAT